MKTLRNFKVKNKRVLVRCDFNVPLDNQGNILDDFRIKETIPTIEYLIKKGAKVILMGHLGRPGGKKVPNLKLDKVQEKLTEYLDYNARATHIYKAPDCVGSKIEKYIQEMQIGEILLLENLRFHKEEIKGDLEFAQAISKLGDIYINDAFGAVHRQHASIVGVPKYLPSGAGFLLEKEIKILSKVLENPQRPLMAIIGGVKAATKIKLIKQFLKLADHLLIGGKIANTVLVVKEAYTGIPFPPEEVVKEIEKFDLTSTKLHLPFDVIVSPDKTGKIYVR